MSKMTGGISDKEEPANAEIQALVEQVKDQITGKMNASFNVFEPISYKTQVVAGRNYFVKVGNLNASLVILQIHKQSNYHICLQIHVGNDECIHARIYKNLQREVSVHSIEENKTKEDPIAYF